MCNRTTKQKVMFSGGSRFQYFVTDPSTKNVFGLVLVAFNELRLALGQRRI